MIKVVRRILTIFPLIVLQIAWIGILYSWLTPWAPLIEAALSVFKLIFVLFLITKKEESTYKILWLLLILSFPIPGTILYLFFGNKRTLRPLKRKMNKMSALPPIENDSARIYEQIRNEDNRLCQTLLRVEKETGYPIHKNQQADYYPLGDNLYPEILKELEMAKKFIFVEYFIVESGVMWDSIVDILARKASQGVDVRVLYDDFGSIGTYTNQEAQQLRGKGIKCQAFNPVIFIKGTINCRDHRKMLIIDGEVAFSGGVNLADEYINQKVKYGHWKDIGFKLTGECVSNYTRMFAEFWNAFTKEPLSDEYLTAPSHTQEDGADGYVLSYYDSPLKFEGISNELYIDLLAQAENYAWFYTPYLIPGDALLNAFINAAKRGVDIRIIVPGIPDKKITYRISRSFYPVLLGAGVKIYEYTPGFVHAKGCVIDGIVGTIGTVNLDYRSLFLNFENNSIFFKSHILDQFEADFLETQSHSYERTVKNYELNFGKWFIDGVLRLIAPLC